MQPTKGRLGTGHRLSEADVVKLLQSRANWLSCRVLHCCNVDLVVLGVRLSPGSDRIADHSGDPGCAISGQQDPGQGQVTIAAIHLANLTAAPVAEPVLSPVLRIVTP
jgi:hypothetical protein